MFILNVLGKYYIESTQFSLLNLLIVSSIIGFVLILSWFVRKGPIVFNLNKNQGLENYSLSFNSGVIDNPSEINIKKVSITTKIILYLLSIILVLIPFYELVDTLKPDIYSNWIRFISW